MVGNHAQARRFQIRRAGDLGRGADQRAEQIDVVVAVDALHHGRDALQTHPRVDRRLGERRQNAFRRAVVLHEHQIPDLHIAVTVLFRRTGWAAGNLRAVIVEDLGARAARPCLSHRPEVRLLAHARAAAGADADLFGPNPRGLVVLAVDRHPKPILRYAERPGDEIPREMNRLALEVVAEAEIAEHLEERVMPRRITDILEVVVLAARPHAALGRCGARIVACFLA